MHEYWEHLAEEEFPEEEEGDAKQRRLNEGQS